MVGAHAGFAIFAVDHAVRETGDVAGGFPYFVMRYEAGVESDHITSPLDEIFPPEILDIAEEFGSHGTVVVGVGEAPIDLGARVDKSAAFGKSHNFVHKVFCHIKNIIT
jgi:hypothetical protein